MFAKKKNKNIIVIFFIVSFWSCNQTESSTNFKDIKTMGYKPFIVGFISMLTVGIVCIITIESYLRFFI